MILICGINVQPFFFLPRELSFCVSTSFYCKHRFLGIDTTNIRVIQEGLNDNILIIYQEHNVSIFRSSYDPKLITDMNIHIPRGGPPVT